MATTYYKSQLDLINTKSEYTPTIKVFGPDGNNTKHMDLNKESATELVKWLTDNFLNTNLPTNWVVINDGTSLFKNTVVKFLNEKYLHHFNGNIEGDYYGVQNGVAYLFGGDYLFDSNMNILTLEKFIELTK